MSAKTSGNADEWDEAQREFDEAADFASSALARAQKVARSKGHLRASMPRISRRPRLRGLSEEGAALRAGDQEAEDQAPAPPSSTSSGEASLRELARRVDVDGDLYSVDAVTSTSGSLWARQHGMAATRVRYRAPKALGGALGRLVADAGWDQPTRMGSVMAKWTQIVGEDVARQCTIETFEGGTLVVRCASTAWMKQLRLLLPTIERRIDEEVGAGVVTQVVVRGPVAPSWKKGRWSVPGRGPRDTYG